MRTSHLVQLLVYLGNIIGRGAYYQVEATKHYTNLFAVLTGKTSRGRRGSNENWVRRLFELIDEAWAANRLQNGVSSGEGVISAVRDAIEKTEPIKEKSTGKITGYQQVLIDPGIEDKRLLIREPEFAAVL